jgi:hypothetical protein
MKTSEGSDGFTSTARPQLEPQRSPRSQSADSLGVTTAHGARPQHNTFTAIRLRRGRRTLRRVPFDKLPSPIFDLRRGTQDRRPCSPQASSRLRLRLRRGRQGRRGAGEGQAAMQGCRGAWELGSRHGNSAMADVCTACSHGAHREGHPASRAGSANHAECGLALRIRLLDPARALRVPRCRGSGSRRASDDY